MITIALRFSNNFAPPCGTIVAHQEVVDAKGYVWYGKLGGRISAKVVDAIFKNDTPKILLIHSGAIWRYWAYIDKVQCEIPPLHEIPAYYRHMASDFKVWFRIIKFEEAPKNILSLCNVVSSGALLSQASRHSMSPYFIIDVVNEQ